MVRCAKCKCFELVGDHPLSGAVVSCGLGAGK